MENLFASVSVLTLTAVIASTNLAHAQIDERLWGLSMIGVEKAWQSGFSGHGVPVGVMDTAIQFDHPEFADRWLGGINVDGSPYGPYDDDYHGTHVTGTVAGRRVGVAPESLIYSINWLVPSRNDQTYAEGYKWATGQGVRVINNSWGLHRTDPISGKEVSLTIAEAAPDYMEKKFPEMLSALRRSVEADIIHVFATGNSAKPQPGILSGLPYFHPELQSNWLAVTAVGPTGNIASYAERCGLAAAWCLAAPGGDGPEGFNDAIWSSWPGSGYYSINGTSMATPHVTGAVAIAAQMFPHASGSELTQLVLQTATDIGDPGIDPIYGWGLLNVGNMVDTIDPGTAGTFANAAWARFTTLGHVSTVLRQRLTAPNVANYSGNSGFELLGYASADTSVTRASVTVSGATKPDIWIAPVYGTASIASSPTSFSATSTVGGLVVGADILNGDATRFGVALGYTNTRLESDMVADRGDANAFHLGAYGGWENGSWFVDGTGQAAFFNQSIERHAIAGASGISFDPVGRSRLSGTGLDLSVQAGHQFDASERFTIFPYLSFAARWQNTSEASETGAGIFSLALPAATYGQFEAGAGLRVETAQMRLDQGTLRMAGDISYARLGGDTNNATSTILLGRSIEGRGGEPGRDILRVGAEFNLSTSEKYDWFALYQGSFQARATSHTLGVGVTMSF